MIDKVLFVASPWLGGSGTVAFRLAEATAEKGIETHFISYEKPFKSVKENKIQFHIVKGYEYSLFPYPLYELALAEEIVKTVIEHDITVVNVHYGVLFGHAVQLAKSILATYNRTIKIVLTLHGSDVIGFDFEKPGTALPLHLNNWVIQNSDVITVASKSLRNMVWQINGNFREIKLIPNFVDRSIYNTEKVKNRASEKVVIHISNFRKVKQPLKVIEIFEKVSKAVPDAKLLLVGDGPLRSEVERYIHEHGIKQVEFHGKLDREEAISELLQRAKVLLLPSLYENFPLVAIEALSCGVSVVASDRGGIPEIIKNGETGFTFDIEDVDLMAGKTVEVLTNVQLFETLSQQAVDFSTKFTIENIVEQYLHVFSS